MNERIARLTQLTMEGKRRPQPISVAYDPEDLFLEPVTASAKRAAEYILAQEPCLVKECALTGHLIFDGSVESDIFQRMGHHYFGKAFDEFYNRPILNVVTFEWQHSTADF